MTDCRCCNKIYLTAGHYSNHLRRRHPGQATPSETPLPRRTAEAPQEEPDLDILEPVASELEDISQSWEGSSDLDGFSNSEPSSEDLEEQDSEIGSGTTDEELEESDVGSGPEEQEESDHGSGTKNYATEFTPHMVCRCPDAEERIRDYLFSQQRSSRFNHLYPFHTARDYKLARFLVLSEVPKTQINDFFQDDILSSATVDGKKDISFQSGHTLYKQTSRMTQDPEWRSGQVEFWLRPKSEFRF